MSTPSRQRDVVVVGASAGGVEALRALMAGFPADLPAAVLVVLHLPAGGTSALPAILDRAGPLRAVSASAGAPLRHGVVQVAPPDHHLLVAGENVVLSHGPTENGHRPAVNALFRSAAVAAGNRAIGVVLSGTLDDGVAGLQAIRDVGGRVLVQDPEDALYPGMPGNALRDVVADRVASAAELGELIRGFTREQIAATTPAAARTVLEDRIARFGGEASMPSEHDPEAIGPYAGFSCPDCEGTLNEARTGPGQYRCRVGHAWSARALLEAQGNTLERALWTALRTLDEKVTLATRMSADAEHRGHDRLAVRYRSMADETSSAAEVLREHLAAMSPPRRADHLET